MAKGMTVIGDNTGVISLGGVMGGVSTSCDEHTTTVFIEAAHFDPKLTARTGRSLQISSDARYRFERGVDPMFAINGLEIATRLVLELCGTRQTKVSVTTIQRTASFDMLERKKVIAFDPTFCLKRTGVDVGIDEQTKILGDLGFTVKNEGNRLTVAVPTWRPDIEGASDLVEEIIRIKGFDAIKATSLEPLSAVTELVIDSVDRRAHVARRALASQGLMEAVTWSFMSSAIAKLFGNVDRNLILLNPISADLDVMRPTIVANHILAAKKNADRGFPDIAIFEIGPIFKNATPEGQQTVASTLRSGHTARNWAAPSRPVDVFDAKADALAVLKAIGAPVLSLQTTTDAPSWYHPGRSGSLRLGPTLVAYFGELHPEVLEACHAEAPAVVSEIFLDLIPQSRSSGTARSPLKMENLQPISRDFSFVVDRAVSAARLVKAVKEADKKFIIEVGVFDIYEGAHLEAGKKSIALTVVLQPHEKTLTDPEIEAVSARIAEMAEKATGAVLRS